MGFIQLLASLWPFLKEMFVGEKINDPASSKRGGGSPQDKKEGLPVKAARWCIEKMQKSRKFLATIVTILIISIFINYKLISKVATLMPVRNEENPAQVEAPSSKKSKEVPTVPRKDSSERDVLLEQTVRELKDLYGESK
jgi:hypothetical protein